jgi:hypothetical protein
LPDSGAPVRLSKGDRQAISSLEREGRMLLFITFVVLGVGLFVYGVWFLFFKKNLGSDD